MDILKRMQNTVPKIKQSVKYSYSTIYNKKHNLFKAADYTLNSQGKVLRGFITKEISTLSSLQEDEAIKLATIIEIIHLATLIQDDLPCMDNSDYRRNILSCHKKFDDATAVLFSTDILILAIQKLSKLDIKSSTIDYTIQKIREIYVGQSLDIENQQNKVKNEIDMLDIYKYKTGSLFSLSLTLPVVISTKSQEIIDILELLGYKIGIMFQIKDDLEDNAKHGIQYTKGLKYSQNYIKQSIVGIKKDILSQTDIYSDFLCSIMNYVFKSYIEL